MKKLFFLLFLSITISANTQSKEYYVLIGTYTTDIHVYKMNVATGAVTFISKISATENPSYLCVSKNEKFVYAVNENHGDKSGEISAYSFDKKKGELHLLNKVESEGSDPCYIDVDSSGKWVVAGNYSSGNLSIFSVQQDGSLQKAVETIQHEGYSVNVVRQSKPHVHYTNFSPDNKYVFVNDLGTDKVYSYAFHSSDQQHPLTEEPTITEVPDGSGPRHLVFHPNKKYAYLINELSGKVIAYEYNDGRLTELQTIESDDTKGKEDKGSADIHITPNGQYLYTTNRAKANDITIYRIGSTGLLTVLGHQSTLGVHPRNFTIDPTGKYLLVANRDSNNIVIFTIIKNSGFLEPFGKAISVDKPVCIKMFPAQ